MARRIRTEEAPAGFNERRRERYARRGARHARQEAADIAIAFLLTLALLAGAAGFCHAVSALFAAGFIRC